MEKSVAPLPNRPEMPRSARVSRGALRAESKGRSTTDEFGSGVSEDKTLKDKLDPQNNDIKIK